MERGKEWKREEEVMQASVLAPVEVDQMSHRQPDCRGHDAGPRWHKKHKIYFVFTSSSFLYCWTWKIQMLMMFPLSFIISFYSLNQLQIQILYFILYRNTHQIIDAFLY